MRSRDLTWLMYMILASSILAQKIVDVAVKLFDPPFVIINRVNSRSRNFSCVTYNLYALA